MSLRIRQVVFAAAALQPTVEQLARVLGLEVCYRDPEVAHFGLENALLPIGDQFLEVVAPIHADTAVGRHLARHGDSAYMLIFQTDAIERDRARLDRLGVRVIWRADYPDMRTSQVHPKDIGAAIVSLDQPDPAESWRWAGPTWQRCRSITGARGIVAASVGAGDPEAMARRWGDVLGLGAAVREEGGQLRLALQPGDLRFVRAATDRLVGFCFAVPDVAAVLARAHDMGLPVTDGPTIELAHTRLRVAQG